MISRIQKPGVIPLGNLAQEMVNFGEQQYGQGNARLERFAACIIGCGNAPANEGIYRLFVEFVRALAAKSSVEDKDGEAVEACRKICDLMGWPPREV
ncbi:hypothetical protein CE91St46_10340 [Eubacteriales bacterium]|uniref:hypothetical protein n=1 Tax=Anaerotruncus TaxID=244127 RepID=UPI000E51D70A|nr:hypothetical protein [Anaerotruncus sp. AF02-27]MCM0707255.1 hypothetical protein [Faecalicatena sp. BF-R-105]GKH48087.1 hypothetical protein CE91St45_26490 [Oscillospiraceae bacterium]GKH49923.1 hypothetical protein CE91St46_10340 [Eubacteriales bacterium]RGX55058.1 hypothetical protein DWV16_10800 [Anaerotruncus sp. AF02-27]GKH62559.1 hypothetical protein CE91St47_10280 [Eubacteriales bacterium]